MSDCCLPRKQPNGPARSEGDGSICTFPNGSVVTFTVGDICKPSFDLIISSTDAHLSNKNGISRSICDAAGPSFRTECQSLISRQGSLPVCEVLLMAAGNLPCKYILHLHTPHWNATNRELAVDKLQRAYTNCFNKAKENDLHSIALPPIATGILKTPVGVSALAMFQSMIEFDSTFHVTVMDISTQNLVSFRDEFVALFNEYMKGAAATGSSKDEDPCCICFDTPTSPRRFGSLCDHKGCGECVTEYNQRSQGEKCPVCGIYCRPPVGNQPDGQMNISYLKTALSGYPAKTQTIQIDYIFQSGIQNNKHPNPGQPFKGTHRRAYLPDTREGREVLGLLRSAFDAKLIFTVGRSATTSIDNCVIWNDIHHKTSMNGGSDNYGYPDDTYLNRVKQELAMKGIK